MFNLRAEMFVYLVVSIMSTYMSSKELKCNITKGMFSDERGVTLRDTSGRQVSVFVPKPCVSKDNGEGTVKVRAFRDNQQTWAVLPTEDSLLVRVNDSDLM